MPLALRAAGAMAGFAFIGGCSSLFDPYLPVPNVHVANQAYSTVGALDEPAATNWRMAHDLLKAEHDAAQVQADTYRQAAKTQAQFKAGLAASLIPLNAAALLEGSIHDRSDFVPIVGYGSAAMLGVGTLLSSPAREAIFLQAQSATLCAMSAHDVYFISPNDYGEHLVNQPKQLSDDIVAVKSALTALQDALDSYDAATQAEVDKADAPAKKMKTEKKPKTDKKAKNGAILTLAADRAGRAPTRGEQARAAAAAVKALATTALVRGGADLSAATATLNSLEGARGRVDEAGRSLGARRMAIKAEVDQSIQATGFTMDQLKAAISASALASTQARPSAPSGAGAGSSNGKAEGAHPLVAERDLAPERPGAQIQSALGTLNRALVKLNADKISPNEWLQRQVQKEHDATQAGACRASVEAVLTATPDDPAQVSKDRPLKIKIHAPTVGGAPTFTEVEDGLTATMTTGGHYDYTLTIAEVGDTKPAAQNQSVAVSSGTQTVNVAFTVTDANVKSSGGISVDARKPGTGSVETPKPSDKAPPAADLGNGKPKS